MAQSGGRLLCLEFGEDTFHPWTSWGAPIEGEFVERTGQLDNWEPNDDMDRAYVARNDRTLYRGYISDPNDVAWFRIGTPHCGAATVRAPLG